MQKSLMTIPIRRDNNLYQIEVFPFDTPLQIAYRFCTQQNLEFNYISPLSKQIIAYVQLITERGDCQNQSQIRMHFDKFINNPIIRESIKLADTQIRIINNCIQIGQQSIDEFNFSFDKDIEDSSKKVDLNKQLQFEQFQFSFKNKLQDYLSQPSRPSSRSTQRVQQYVKNNSIIQIENLQRQEKLNQKILNRLQNKSPNRKPGLSYREYMRKPSQPKLDINNIKIRETRNTVQPQIYQFSSVQQSRFQSPEKQEQNTIQTLPKGRNSISNSKLHQSRNISPQEISFSQQIDQSAQSSIMSNGTIVNNCVQQKIDKMKQFKLLMGKLQQISTPQKSQRNYEISAKQNNTLQKTEQRINEVFHILDTDKDGFIDHNINLSQLKQHVVELFESVWFQILWKKINVNKKQFQEMIQKRIKDLEPEQVNKFIFNSVKQ